MLLKVCGMKDPSNIQQLATLQPDWVGMIFYEKSLRHVDADLETTEGLKKIGVFVNASSEYIDERIEKYGLSGVQFHGKETPKFCQQYKEKGLTILKAFSINEHFDFATTQPYENSCDYFVFDTKGKNPGGNGITYDWNILQQYDGSTPFLLSGGINPTLTTAIKNFKHQQWLGVDINSGFEIAPGLKNIELIKKFIDELSN